VEPLPLGPDPSAGWGRLVAAVRSLPRTTVVEDDGTYLHAESRSAFFGFVDDLEIRNDALTGRAQVRSAARLGYFDLGVNRARVEALRGALAQED